MRTFLTTIVLLLCAGCITRGPTVVTFNKDGTTNSITYGGSHPYYEGCYMEETIRFFGVSVQYDTKTQLPTAKVGWGSQTTKIVPTSTNNITIPNTASTMQIGSSLNPLDTRIQENSGTGNVAVGMGTNNSSITIVPEAFSHVPTPSPTTPAK